MKHLPFALILLFGSVHYCHAFDEKPKQLNQTELDNLIAFANLYGYVRYFHPSDEALATDWDRFAVNGVQKIEGVKDSTELLATLNSIFMPVAPSMKIDWSQNIRTGNSFSKTTDKVRYWRHKGYGDHAFTFILKWFTPYKSKVKTAKIEDLSEKKAPSPDSLFYAELPRGIAIRMPVALYVKGGNTFPKTDFKKEKKGKQSDYDILNRSVRHADVIIEWNVLKFFYPYWNVTPVNWDQSLVTALQKSAQDTTRKGFGETLNQLTVDLQDGHASGYYWNRSEKDTSFKPGNLPLTLDWVENKFVIGSCENCDSLGVKRGDELKTINGKDAAAELEEIKKTISSATEQWKMKLLLTYYSFFGEKDSVMTLGFENAAGEPYERKLTMSTWTNPSPFSKEKIKELEDGIYYVNLGAIKGKDFKKALPQLKTAKGIIFDNRCYPKTGPSYLQYLADHKLKSARWMIPVVQYPETIHTEFDTAARWNMKPKQPQLTCPVVFLTNGWAISYAESLMGIAEAYKFGEIVGEPTAGTNGNINMVSLPGHCGFVFTGMQVLKNDGSQHHRVGIQPTVPCSKTIQGIREGRDEQLEKALEVVKRPEPGSVR